MPTIHFIIYQLHGNVVTEDALNERPFRYEELFDEYGSCEGALLIRDEGLQELKLEDELATLIKNMCFSCNRELKVRGESSYHFESFHGHLTMTRRGHDVLVESELFSAATYEIDSFRRELYKCGMRFIGVLRRLETSGDPSEQNKQALITLLETARKELDVM
jgi:hypothetical protein